MSSTRAKVLHPLCGRPLIHYVLDAARGAGARSIVVVIGVGGDEVRALLADQTDVHFATQTEQRGTGDALRAARHLVEDYAGPLLVLAGDMPLLRPEPLSQLIDRLREASAACVLGTAEVENPRGFGRIVRDAHGGFERIVEERDASEWERAIREINPSCYVFDAPGVWEGVDQLGTANAQGEYYLTDVPAILKRLGRTVEAARVLEAYDVLGVNTRRHLADAHEALQARVAERLLAGGVSIVDPRNTYIDPRAEIGPDTVIYPFTLITGQVRIGSNCRIGPFAHLREGTILQNSVQVGAFVEISASNVGEGTIARHLAYLGNANLGPNVNVGAGFITANFDGKAKHGVEIGPEVQLGAGAIAVAPVRIGRGAVLGAGAVVTRGHDVAAESTVVGVPARPLERES
jgi:bifunctional UDP-N-acetylglucosamine pyrophosphorylase/glucosamine-1-phosphate N-acetyltransferase